jgi:CDP-diacylglycerol--serine O-phosphatidyltransferase
MNRLQRGVIILPSAFTLGNLFFGIYAIVAATRGDYEWAAWFVVFAGVLDMLDGRIARVTRTGSKFGAELDSLVDAISFGVAPGFLMYAIFFSDAREWSWLMSYLYIVAVVVRLARFNVDQAGEAKRHFVGLPSPSAGMFLASWYPFSQTSFFERWMAAWDWTQIMAMAMVLVAVLMVSHVPYAKVPRLELRTLRGRLTTAWILFLLTLAVTIPRYYFFTALTVYIVWSLGRSFFNGLLDRLPERDPLDDHDDMPQRTVDHSLLNPPISRDRTPENDS